MRGRSGGLIGSIVTTRLSRRIGIGPAYLLGAILFPVPLLLVPLADGPMWLILAMLFLAEFGSGLGVMILDISAASIFAALVPPRLRSRVSGAYTVVNYGVRPIGSLIGGFLGTQLGLKPALWIATVGAILGFLWLLPSPIPRCASSPRPRSCLDLPKTSAYGAWKQKGRLPTRKQRSVRGRRG